MRNNHSARCLVIVAMLIAAGCPDTRGEESPKEQAASILNMNDGDFYTGMLRDCPTRNVVRWQARGAVQPFDFPVDMIRGVYFAPSVKRPAPEGDYCIELTGGDLLFGSLVSISPEQIEIESAQFGRILIARDEVRRLTPRSGGNASEYRGPDGLAEWTQTNRNEWREEAGRLVTDKHGTSVRRDIPIPEQARIEFEISWKKAPQFTLAFCSSERKQQLDEAFRFEVWDRTVVIIRELKQDADVAIIGDIDANTNRVHLECLYNHPTGEFTVNGINGKQLAKITMPKETGKPLRWVCLINNGADLQLEQLNISKWNGLLPPQVATDKARVHKNDSTITYGDVVGYEADTKQLVIRSYSATGVATDSRVDSSQVACIVLTPDNPVGQSAVRVGLHDGSRCSGDLVKVDGDDLYLQRRGVEHPIACAVANVRSLVGLQHGSPKPSPAKQRVGRLELEGVSSHGSLDPATADSQTSCLVWRPRSSLTSSALVREVSGRIVYRDPPPPKKVPQSARLRQRQPPRPVGFVGGIAEVLSGSAPSPAASKSNGANTICLVAGDRIPCEAAQIDEAGVHFSSSVIASKSIPHSEVKALELVPNWTAAALAEEKRMRLLTLPRMQKGNPPTHLIVSTNGDFLRGRLVSLTAATLAVENRLETKQFPRDRVACIIWLHDEQKLARPPQLAEHPPTATLAQAVNPDGIRLTFVPHECKEAGLLTGESEILGKCQIDLMTVDQVIFGEMIKFVAKELTYGIWKLSDAVEPEFTHDAAAGGATDGTPKVESNLVNKPAPDFHLDLLDGTTFKLSEQKGHIIVLDFWASWCGPCMQAMPQVDEVLRELSEKGAKLIAVNMQEDRAAITGALERLKISPPVALDIDGAVAERYQVSAIPQTVVIDSEGNVAKLFIGANPGFADQIRATIQDLLTHNQKQQTPLAPSTK